MGFDFGFDDADFGEVCLFIRLVEVGPKGVGEATLPLLEGGEKTTKHLLAKADVERGACAKVGALLFYYLG